MIQLESMMSSLQWLMEVQKKTADIKPPPIQSEGNVLNTMIYQIQTITVAHGWLPYFRTLIKSCSDDT